MSVRTGLLVLALVLASPNPAGAASASADAELEALITAMARTGSAAGAQYSPYGTQIAYLTNLSGVAQVWRILRVAQRVAVGEAVEQARFVEISELFAHGHRIQLEWLDAAGAGIDVDAFVA